MQPQHYDVVVVGSGFGGSVTALRLSEKGYRVGVLESGRRYGPDDYARTSWNLRHFLWMPGLGLRGIQRLDLLRDVLVLSGAGVGGGSLVYANTLIEPHDAFFEDRQWRHITDWKEELAPYFDQARRMLGVTTAPDDTPSDEVVAEVARRLGAAETHVPTEIGVFFGTPEQREPDPYFGGAGPEVAGCNECGGCMVGCRYEAKNTLDRNYLYLAEQAGAEVHAEHRVVDVVEIGDGYRITARRPGALVRRRRRTFTADEVVFSAGALGTAKLLFRLRDKGRLNGLPEGLGRLARTNSESLLGATAHRTNIDYTHGVAITSSFHPEPQTRIEPVRYSKGSNFMGLIASILVPGEGRLPRPLRFLGRAIRYPIAFARSLSVHRWAERTVILLVMQSEDNSVQLYRKRGIFGPRITSRHGHGPPSPRWLPVGHQAARMAAEIINGDPVASINESFAGIGITAHIIGGAVISDGPETGAIDPYHRMWDHPRLHVVDGAALCANLGSNPSLTITALAERAAAMWPNQGEPDTRPAQGEPYRRVDPVTPRRPVVPEGAPAALRY